MISNKIKELCDNLWEGLDGEVTKVEHDKHKKQLKIQFEYDDWIPNGGRKRVFIIAKDVVESSLNQSICDELVLLNEHPILWNHNFEQFTLFYTSSPQNAYEILGMLWEKHENLMQGARDVSDYINPQNYLNHAHGGYGQLASGPEPLLKKYQEAIKNKLKTNMVSSYMPECGYSVMIFDYGYVVAKFFQLSET